LLTVPGDRDLIAGAPQVTTDHITDQHIVVHDQH
jgi:hypothetical protein